MTRVFLGFAAVFALLLLAVRLIYGGGNPARDVNTPAQLDAEQLDIVFSYDQPIGDIAVTGPGEIFFTVHPAAKPAGNKLLRIVDDIALPFPDGKTQQQGLQTPLGLFADNNSRLWVIDHANHATGSVRLSAFSIDSGERVYEHTFASDIAPLGALLQHLVVSRDGQFVMIADTSIVRRSPALIVHDTSSKTSRRMLEQDSGITSQDFLINNSFRPMRFFSGLFSLMPGLTALAIDSEETWLYLAAMSNDGLYRVPLSIVTDPAANANDIETAVERYSDKPLSDGLYAGSDGDVYITDIEHHSIVRASNTRRLQTLMQSTRMRWPAALAVDDTGALYVGDSALPLYLFGAPGAVDTHKPYHIFRIALPNAVPAER
ncbi:MAG: L-dopachrome tautomerase-related protein [Pseudomonadota bacterium]